MNSQTSSSPAKTVITAEEFISRYYQLKVDIKTLATELVAGIDSNPKLIAEIVERGIPRTLITRWELLGRGQLDQRLLYDAGSAANALIKAPLSIQVEVLDNGVEVLDDDEQSVRLIPYQSLAPSQCRQVFCSGKVRDLAAQRTYIRAKKSKIKPVNHPDYRITKDGIETARAGLWTWKLILQWLQERN